VRTTWNFVATTNAKKTAGYGAMLGLAERGSLYWPCHPEFLRQLRGLRFEQGERGFTRIEAENPVIHDDVADAAMLAMLPHSPPRGRGRIVCGLTALADPKRAVADAELPELAEDHVEAGSGVRFPRRVPLQSIEGRELWVPPEALVPRRRRARLARLRMEDRDRVLAAIDPDHHDQEEQR
jgi:hypothetical protein